ncbi:hypothetical protein ABT173_38435 [Streptomyces sp. NPDC001795]|uniref:hypothetical protein n=1 Tax=unclassified Streptomyces TaxID=2593676 RepID=UPI00332ECE2F
MLQMYCPGQESAAAADLRVRRSGDGLDMSVRRSGDGLDMSVRVGSFSRGPLARRFSYPSTGGFPDETNSSGSGL